mmetsp:Transcript_87414/g.182929  ORF Transcript_87414/g.182929 Transcript_87414/m.182929 type:complete len:156 (-) Transcript_87414:343-810(-)
MAAFSNQRRGSPVGLASTGSQVMTLPNSRRVSIGSVHPLAVSQVFDSRAAAGQGINKLGASSIPAESKGWDWCRRTSRPSIDSGSQFGGSDFAASDLLRSMSSPSMGASLLKGQLGQEPEPYHGEARSFGVSVVDCRMRGGRLARNGWAGTFPLH